MHLKATRGLLLVVILTIIGVSANAAPYAALVMDARTGEVLHSRNADTRLHPASLTKMMTLYLAFKAVESGHLSLDEKVKVSRNAASEPPSKLGLRTGMRVKVRHLIRAAAVKSANDAATALGEAIAGTEAKFTALMTAQAKALGMKRTTFKNAHGLTAKGHLSTARDMSILGRHLMYDFPDYYNLFSRRNTDAGLRTVPNTNRRLLANYKGADGIKTGYTNAAGFNLVSSAQRGNKRIIATVFGGRTWKSRNARVAELLDMGFNRTPKKYTSNAIPARPSRGSQLESVALVLPNNISIKSPRIISSSPRPKYRPNFDLKTIEMASAVREDLEAEIIASAQANIIRNTTANVSILEPISSIIESQNTIVNAVSRAHAQRGYIEPVPYLTRVVTREFNKNDAKWSVQLGAYNNRYNAEKMLLRTALTDLDSLEGAVRKITPATINGRHLYRARFIGVSEESAMKACARLRARNQPCTIIGPGA
ncbi:D-alanyl-D-alanine carboxypeptidase [Amylibacter sp.]|nr:D-alanyl-D-alanine carboxypeptidase [Amylibacter sp.]|tara:strand:+ start:4742 stop:6187 length:1446 start_codon:yes stop_codon:yes gene_type:complete